MRRYTILLIIALLLTSCNPDDGQPPLTPDLVTEVNVYDLDNKGNSADIRVDFIVENNLNVSEYRVMVIPTSIINSFDQSVAVSMPRDRYLLIDPISFETEYSINRLPTTLLDVNDALIFNGVEYVVAILVEGIGNFQLSEFSRPFTLKEQGIYNGYYEGIAGTASISFFLSVQVVRIAGVYTGEMEVEDFGTTTISIITFKVVNEIISNCTVVGGSLGGTLILFDPGSGIVKNDLVMQISFNNGPTPGQTIEMVLRRVIKN